MARLKGTPHTPKIARLRQINSKISEQDIEDTPIDNLISRIMFGVDREPYGYDWEVGDQGYISTNRVTNKQTQEFVFHVDSDKFQDKLEVRAELTAPAEPIIGESFFYELEVKYFDEGWNEEDNEDQMYDFTLYNGSSSIIQNKTDIVNGIVDFFWWVNDRITVDMRKYELLNEANPDLSIPRDILSEARLNKPFKIKYKFVTYDYNRRRYVLDTERLVRWVESVSGLKSEFQSFWDSTDEIYITIDTIENQGDQFPVEFETKVNRLQDYFRELSFVERVDDITEDDERTDVVRLEIELTSPPPEIINEARLKKPLKVKPKTEQDYDQVPDNAWGWNQEIFDEFKRDGYYDTGNHWVWSKINDHEYEATYDDCYMDVYGTFEDMLLQKNEIASYEYDQDLSDETGESTFIDVNGDIRIYPEPPLNEARLKKRFKIMPHPEEYWVGSDANIETSLFDYGFVMRQPKDRDYPDEWFVLYQTNNAYDMGWIREEELNNLMKGDSWLEEDDISEILNIYGLADVNEWLEMSMVYKFSDLFSQYGPDNVMGTSYHTISEAEAKEKLAEWDEFEIKHRLEEARLKKQFKQTYDNVYEGDVDLYGSQNISFNDKFPLTNVTQVIGDVNLGWSMINRFGKLKYITGTLIISESEITTLNELHKVDGCIWAEDSQLHDFGYLESCKCLKVSNTPNLHTLGQYFKRTTGYISADGKEDFSLGSCEEVGGDLYLRYTRNIDLGNLNHVAGSVNITGSDLTAEDFWRVRIDGSIITDGAVNEARLNKPFKRSGNGFEIYSDHEIIRAIVKLEKERDIELISFQGFNRVKNAMGEERQIILTNTIYRSNLDGQEHTRHQLGYSFIFLKDYLKNNLSEARLRKPLKKKWWENFNVGDKIYFFNDLEQFVFEFEKFSTVWVYRTYEDDYNIATELGYHSGVDELSEDDAIGMITELSSMEQLIRSPKYLSEARLRGKTKEQNLKDKVYDFLNKEGQIWRLAYDPDSFIITIGNPDDELGFFISPEDPQYHRRREHPDVVSGSVKSSSYVRNGYVVSSKHMGPQKKFIQTILNPDQYKEIDDINLAAKLNDYIVDWFLENRDKFLTEARLKKPLKDKTYHLADIINEFDRDLTNVEKLNEPNMGRNLFQIWSNSIPNLNIRLLMYPSGKFSTLSYHIGYINKITEKYNISTKEFQHLLGEWFKKRHYNLLTLNEAKLNKPFRVLSQEYMIVAVDVENHEGDESEFIKLDRPVPDIKLTKIIDNLYTQFNFVEAHPYYEYYHDDKYPEDEDKRLVVRIIPEDQNEYPDINKIGETFNNYGIDYILENYEKKIN